MSDFFKNKYFSVLGDSISTFGGCSEPCDAVFYDTANKLASGVLTPSDTWWGRVIEKFGGRLLVNNSFSGSTVCWHPLYEIQSYSCSDERTSSLGRDGISPDVIMVYMGTNDWGRGISVSGDGRYENDGVDSPVFFTAYKSMLKKLRHNYPEAEIWCFTLAKSRFDANENFSFPYTYGGRHISEYCDAIKAAAAEYRCKVADLYNIAKPYDTIDGFHANYDGMKTISDAVISVLCKTD